jgi:hypothetical protein
LDITTFSGLSSNISTKFVRTIGLQFGGVFLEEFTPLIGEQQSDDTAVNVPVPRESRRPQRESDDARVHYAEVARMRFFPLDLARSQGRIDVRAKE